MLLEVSHLYGLVFLALAIWLIWAALGASRLAHEQARSTCRNNGLQWLDESAVLKRVHWAKDPKGRWGLVRTYQFEFTASGSHRYRGWLYFRGKSLVHTELEPWHMT